MSRRVLRAALVSIALVPPSPDASEMPYHQGTVLSSARTQGGSGANAGAAAAETPGGGAVLTVQRLPLIKQYVVAAISGGAYSGELLAFRLPN